MMQTDVPSKQVFRLFCQIAEFYPSFPKAGTLDMKFWNKIGESFYVPTIEIFFKNPPENDGYV